MNKWTRIAPTNPPTRTRYNEIPTYAEGLYDLGHQLYAWMVPNGSWGESNAGLIVGDGEALLVDTLWDVKYTRGMLSAMRPLLDATPLKYVVNTHADGDHFWGNELVADKQIITSQASYDEMVNTKPASLLLLGRVGKALSLLGKLPGLGNWGQIGHWFQNMVLPYQFQEVTPTLPSRTFQGQLSLDVGGREVQLIEIGPMHTHGDLMVYVPDAKTLYSADALFIGSTPVMWAGPIENWLAALDKMLAMDIETIIPGHGPITDKEGVRQVKAYWLYVADQVRTRYQAGMSARDAAYDIALSHDFAQQPFAKWNSPERIMVSTHTLYRHLQGRRDHPKVPELLNTMRKQALLAHQLPNAQPAVMRKP